MTRTNCAAVPTEVKVSELLAFYFCRFVCTFFFFFKFLRHNVVHFRDFFCWLTPLECSKLYSETLQQNICSQLLILFIFKKNLTHVCCTIFTKGWAIFAKKKKRIMNIYGILLIINMTISRSQLHLRVFDSKLVTLCYKSILTNLLST